MFPQRYDRSRTTEWAFHRLVVPTLLFVGLTECLGSASVRADSDPRPLLHSDLRQRSTTPNSGASPTRIGASQLFAQGPSVLG